LSRTNLNFKFVLIKNKQFSLYCFCQSDIV